MHVRGPDGTQTVLRQSRDLFNNPLGVEAINRPPAASLSVTPRRHGHGGQVVYDASGSTDPEPRPPLHLGSRRRRKTREKKACA